MRSISSSTTSISARRPSANSATQLPVRFKPSLSATKEGMTSEIAPVSTSALASYDRTCSAVMSPPRTRSRSTAFTSRTEARTSPTLSPLMTSLRRVSVCWRPRTAIAYPSASSVAGGERRRSGGARMLAVASVTRVRGVAVAHAVVGAVALCGVGLGLALRGMPVLANDFPLNDGGLFSVMIEAVRGARYGLPWSVTYNGLEIPFAYPPLGFVLGALLADLTHTSGIAVLRWLPLALNLFAMG